MKRSLFIRSLTLVALAALILAPAARAASYINEATSDVNLTWDDDARWQGSGTPDGVGDSATFIGFTGTSPKYWDLGGKTITLGAIRYEQADSIQIRMTNGTIVLQDASGTATIYRKPFRGYAYDMNYILGDQVLANLVLNSNLRLDIGEDSMHHSSAAPHGWSSPFFPVNVSMVHAS